LKKVWLGSLSFLLGIALVGCGSGPSQSRFRVVNASPDAPNLDIFLDGVRIRADLPYRSGIAYQKAQPGSRHLLMNSTGTTTALLDLATTFNAKQDYTVLAVDLLASIAPLVLTDDNTAPSSGNARLRIVHAAPSAGPVDIYITAPGADISTATPTLSGVAFKSVSDYMTEAAGTYEMRLTPAGSKLVIETGTITLTDGQVRTALTLDAPLGGFPFSVLLLQDLK